MIKKYRQLDQVFPNSILNGKPANFPKNQKLDQFYLQFNHVVEKYSSERKNMIEKFINPPIGSLVNKYDFYFRGLKYFSLKDDKTVDIKVFNENLLVLLEDKITVLNSKGQKINEKYTTTYTTIKLMSNRIVIFENYRPHILIWDPITDSMDILDNQETYSNYIVLKDDRIVTGSPSGNVRIWDHGQFILKEHKGIITKLQQCNNLLAVGTINGELTLWDLNTYECVLNLKVGSTSIKFIGFLKNILVTYSDYIQSIKENVSRS